MEFAVFFQIAFFILVTQVRNSSSKANLMDEIKRKDEKIQNLSLTIGLYADYIKNLEANLAGTYFVNDRPQKCTNSLTDQKKKCKKELKLKDERITIRNRNTTEKDTELQKCRKTLEEEENKNEICEDEKREKDRTISALRTKLTAIKRDYEICTTERIHLRTENEQLSNKLNLEMQKHMMCQKTIIIKQEEIEQLKRSLQVVKKVDQGGRINPSQVETKQECPIIPNFLDVLNVAQTVKKGFSHMLRSVFEKLKL